MLDFLFAFLLGTFLGVSAQIIHQRPAVSVQSVGSSLSLECTVKGQSSPNLYWYWQDKGGTLQQLFYSKEQTFVSQRIVQTPEASPFHKLIEPNTENRSGKISKDTGANRKIPWG